MCVLTCSILLPFVICAFLKRRGVMCRCCFEQQGPFLPCILIGAKLEHIWAHLLIHNSQGFRLTLPWKHTHCVMLSLIYCGGALAELSCHNTVCCLYSNACIILFFRVFFLSSFQTRHLLCFESYSFYSNSGNIHLSGNTFLNGPVIFMALKDDYVRSINCTILTYYLEGLWIIYYQDKPGLF